MRIMWNLQSCKWCSPLVSPCLLALCPSSARFFWGNRGKPTELEDAVFLFFWMRFFKKASYFHTSKNSASACDDPSHHQLPTDVMQSMARKPKTMPHISVRDAKLKHKTFQTAKPRLHMPSLRHPPPPESKTGGLTFGPAGPRSQGGSYFGVGGLLLGHSTLLPYVADDRGCVSGRRPKCVAALHVPLGGAYFWYGWSGSFRGVLLLGRGLTFGMF